MKGLFWKKIQVSAFGCWEWTGKINKDGYGYILVGSRTDGSRHYMFAHRYAYEAVWGPIPSGKELHHLCENRCCVNPWHLEAISHGENVRRGRAAEVARQRRLRPNCPKGHPYTPENTYNYKGKRYCRQCRRECDSKRKEMRYATTHRYGHNHSPEDR